MNRTSSKKNGIALVIVIGLLFIITVLAVGFIVTARTERMASRSHVDAVRTRQIVQVAVADAVRKLDSMASVAGTKFFYPPSTNLYTTGALSVGAPASNALYQAILTNGYIPNPDGLAAARAAQALRFARWVQVTNINASIQATNRFRYAWIAVDCSGLVDANATTNLGLGPIGIGVSNIVEQTYGAGASRVGRVESVADMRSLPGNLQSPFLFTYSRSTGGGGTAATMIGHTPIYLGGTAAEIKTNAAIQTALTTAGFNAAQSTNLIGNLVDYVDADDVPGGDSVVITTGANCQGINTEAVPMINELIFNTRFVDAMGQKQMVTKLEVELWYPFVGWTNNGAYNLVVDMQLVTGGANALTTNLRLTNSVPMNGPWTFNEYRTHTFADWTASGSSNAVPPTALRITRVGVVKPGGVYVDFASATPDIPWAGNFAADATEVTTAFQARDPRINWNVATAANQFTKNNTPTRNDRNTGVTGETGNDIAMYVRNQPLTSVGELGYLLYDAAQPWGTLDLFNATHAKIFDHFITHLRPKHGAINPSTPYTNALACAFADKRLNQYPGDATGPVINNAQAAQLASAIINVCPIDPGPGYANLSEVASLAGAAIKTEVAAIAGGSPTATQNESVLRQGMPELSVRQNMFAIVVLAQALAPATANTTPTPIAEQMAVAYVWRDPYKDPTLQYFPRIVQFLRWLDE